MCGIAGEFNTSIDVESMLKRIQHRGPDGQGFLSHSGVSHGHVRLSLVDLSPASSQPFRYRDSVLTFNGEIWDFLAEKKRLEQRGFQFQTTGDTEVLACLLYQDGLKGLSRVEGMFAFCWTRGEERWIVRDRFGEIPIYLAKMGDGYIWSSERKAFPKGLTPVAVPPGFAFNLTENEWHCWYKPSISLTPVSIREKIKKGVRDRLFADASICCLISGGLDSSLILSIARGMVNDLVAFTAVLDPSSEDLKSARRLCSEYCVPLIEVPINPSIDLFRQAIQCIEINSKAQIEIAALCLDLAQAVKAEGFKACLSGEAADELFGGYGNFCIQAYKAKRNEDIVKLRHESLAKMSRGNFVRCNKVFMSAGVECRLPFMNLSLVEYAISLNLALSPAGKKLLKKESTGIIPSWVIKRKKDTFQGGTGIATWVRDRISSPTRFYNAELRSAFGYLPKD